MDELLNKPFNEVTEEEWKQVQQLMNKKKKPSVQFSKATLGHCVRLDGLALNIDYVIIDAPSLHIPTSFPTPVASDLLCQNLRTWTLFFWSCWKKNTCVCWEMRFVSRCTLIIINRAIKDN
jgi:hypothetical protein